MLKVRGCAIVRLVEGWGDAPPFSLVPLADGGNPTTARREFEEAYPEYIADGAWADYVTRYLFIMATDRSVLDRIQADIRPGSAELGETFDRIHDFLLARTRTPKRRVASSEALDLAQQHLAEVIKMRGVRDDEGLAEVLERLADVPIVVREHITECDPGEQFRHGLDPNGIGLESLFPQRDRALLSIDVVEFIDFEALDAGFESDLTLSQIKSAVDAMTDDDVLTLFPLRPCFEGPLDSSAYYRLWEAGASLWATSENIEVRTFTAQRGTNAQYQG